MPRQRDGLWSWKPSKQPEPLFSYLNSDLLKVKTIFFSDSQSLTAGLSPVHASPGDTGLFGDRGNCHNLAASALAFCGQRPVMFPTSLQCPDSPRQLGGPQCHDARLRNACSKMKAAERAQSVFMVMYREEMCQVSLNARFFQSIVFKSVRKRRDPFRRDEPPTHIAIILPRLPSCRGCPAVIVSFLHFPVEMDAPAACYRADSHWWSCAGQP